MTGPRENGLCVSSQLWRPEPAASVRLSSHRRKPAGLGLCPLSLERLEQVRHGRPAVEALGPQGAGKGKRELKFPGQFTWNPHSSPFSPREAGKRGTYVTSGTSSRPRTKALKPMPPLPRVTPGHVKHTLAFPSRGRKGGQRGGGNQGPSEDQEELSTRANGGEGWAGRSRSLSAPCWPLESEAVVPWMLPPTCRCPGAPSPRRLGEVCANGCLSQLWGCPGLASGGGLRG